MTTTESTPTTATETQTRRIALTDGTGRWFDAARARQFREDTDWDGNNNISCATGSQWEHECLYRTASCRYILNSWSNWQGTRETYEEISPSAAAAWLSINNYAGDDCCATEFAALEIK